MYSALHVWESPIRSLKKKDLTCVSLTRLRKCYRYTPFGDSDDDN